MTKSGAVAAEIVRFHDFFEAWYNGDEGRTIGEFSHALDPAFFIVSPDGVISTRDEVVSMVSNGRDSGPVEIRVENVRPRLFTPHDLCVATYEEHQVRGGKSSVMISTVGLAVDTSCPGDFRWLFVHETWQHR